MQKKIEAVLIFLVFSMFSVVYSSISIRLTNEVVGMIIFDFTIVVFFILRKKELLKELWNSKTKVNFTKYHL